MGSLSGPAGRLCHLSGHPNRPPIDRLTPRLIRPRLPPNFVIRRQPTGPVSRRLRPPDPAAIHRVFAHTDYAASAKPRCGR